MVSKRTYSGSDFGDDDALNGAGGPDLESIIPGSKYGPIEFIDYLLPDDDPDLKKMQEEPEDYTLRRYAHNRKKVFFWSNMTLLFGTIATMMLGFGGLLIGAEATTPLFEWLAGSATAGNAAQSVANLTAHILPWIGGGVVIAAGLAFGSGYYSFRTDIKNDVDVESLHAKLTGRYVASHLYEMLKTKEGNSKELDAKAVEPLPYGDRLTPYDERQHGNGGKAPTDKPQPLVSQAEDIARLIQEAQHQRLH